MGDALRLAAREALPLVIGAACMLVLAAAIEAFWSPRTEFPPAVKYAVGGVLWLVTLTYFTLWGAAVQLDRLAVQLRPRNPWEAIDLGFAMVRTWARTVYAAWLTLFVPLCVLACWLLPWQWAIVLVWWLKPALDRIVLHVLAAGVFGELPRLRDTLRALPRALTPGLIASLTWYRFFLVRSFNLPVWQLERQTGARPASGAGSCIAAPPSHAAWLTIACILFELVARLSGSRCSTCSRRCFTATSSRSSSCSTGRTTSCSRSCSARWSSRAWPSWNRSTWRADSRSI